MSSPVERITQIKDLGYLRPFKEDDKFWVIVKDSSKNQRRVRLTDLICEEHYSSQDPSPVLSKEDWLLLDQRMLRAFRERIPATSALWQNKDLVREFDGWGKLQIEEESIVGRDPKHLTFGVDALLLPIIHQGCILPRFPPQDEGIAEPRPVYNTDDVARAAVGVADLVEQSVIGSLINKGRVRVDRPSAPIGVIQGIDELKKRRFYGPFIIFYPKEIEGSIKGSENLLHTKGIDGFFEVPKLEGMRSLFLIQASPDVVRLNIAIQPILVLWEPDKFKVLTSIVPQVRCDFYGNCGIAQVEYK
jgi:hypothetical protein